MFKTKKKKGLMETLMLKEGEREVIQSWGRFKLFDVDERFDVFVDSLVKEMRSQSAHDIEVIADPDEITMILFDILTNLREEDPELLELENFKKILKNPKRVFKKMKIAVDQIALEELLPRVKGAHAFGELPEKVQKNLIESLDRSDQ